MEKYYTVITGTYNVDIKGKTETEIESDAQWQVAAFGSVTKEWFETINEAMEFLLTQNINSVACKHEASRVHGKLGMILKDLYNQYGSFIKTDGIPYITNIDLSNVMEGVE